MSNWLTNIFNTLLSKNSSNDEPVKKKGSKQKAANSPEPLKCSKPISSKTGDLNNERIRQLVPLRKLDRETFSYLPHQFLMYENNSIIFLNNQPSKYIYYLLKGEVNLTESGDKHIHITSDSLRATFPLSSGLKYGSTAITGSKTLILAFSSDVTRLLTKKNKHTEDFELIDINLPKKLNTKFFHDFSNAYYQNHLKLPSLPDIAIKLRQAMKNNIGINEAVEIIQVDLAMTAKLIQVSNSPLYSPASPINNCHDAVNRIGLAATRNLIMSLGLKQLFQSKDKHVLEAMKKIWKRSLYVSSLSYVLAEETKTVDPNDALLAGLISDIGIIPLLTFLAEYEGEKPSMSDIKIAIPYFRAPVGELLLNSLDFPKELIKIPHYSEEWYYDNQDEHINIIDIIILSKLHSYFGLKDADHLPCINTIPAYAKLEKGQLSSDLSLNILRKANQRIKSIMAELS